MTTETNRIQVLGIVGSPRKGGNTETLVDPVLVYPPLDPNLDMLHTSSPECF